MSEIVCVQNEQTVKKNHFSFLRNLREGKTNNDTKVCEHVIAREKTLRHLCISKIQKKRCVTEVVEDVTRNETKKNFNTKRVLQSYFGTKK